jgi:hypothetical protein
VVRETWPRASRGYLRLSVVGWKGNVVFGTSSYSTKPGLCTNGTIQSNSARKVTVYALTA